MAHSNPDTDKLQLGSGAGTLKIAAALVGVLGLAAAVGLSLASPEGSRRFFFAYLWAFAFFLSLGVGGLFFILITFVTRSGWAVAVRRTPEALARTLPLFFVLSLPLLYTVVAKNDGTLYRWDQSPAAADHAHDHASADKSAEGHTAGHAAAHDNKGRDGEATLKHGGVPAAWDNTAAAAKDAPPKPLQYVINSPFPVDPKTGKPEFEEHLVLPKTQSQLLLGQWGFTVRVLVCLGALALVALYYTSASRRQDVTGDESISERLQTLSAPSLVVFGLAVTLIAFDLLLSLDPVFYSTIFGGYYFAGAAISVMATTILVTRLLQAKGYLANTVRTDHYHDLSKFQFAFTFFWGYLAFSQFMLLWYSSQPEALTWLARRGASTAQIHNQDFGTWTFVTLILLFGKLLIPFAGLLSRHVKRNAFGMIFWAAWILVFQALDLFWVVMPEMTGRFPGFFLLPELAAFVGVGGLFLAYFVHNLAGAALRPAKDPRLPESLAFHQAF